MTRLTNKTRTEIQQAVFDAALDKSLREEVEQMAKQESIARMPEILQEAYSAMPSAFAFRIVWINASVYVDVVAYDNNYEASPKLEVLAAKLREVEKEAYKLSHRTRQALNGIKTTAQLRAVLPALAGHLKVTNAPKQSSFEIDRELNDDLTKVLK